MTEALDPVMLTRELIASSGSRRDRDRQAAHPALVRARCGLAESLTPASFPAEPVRSSRNRRFTGFAQGWAGRLVSEPAVSRSSGR